MELKHLRTFLVAAQQGSFTRAARELQVTQAAVSQQVAALERLLNVQLFERAARSVHLTPTGQVLKEYAERLLALSEEAVRAVQGGVMAVTGTVRIATSTVPAEWLVPQLLARFRRSYPCVQEQLFVTDSVAACQAVLGGKADVGFVGEPPASDRLHARPLARDELLLVVSAQHPWAGKKLVSLQQLEHEPLLIREADSGSRHCVERTLHEHGKSLQGMNVALEVNSNDAIRAAVERGLGVAFLSSRSIQMDLAGGRLHALRVRGLKFERQLYVVLPKGRPIQSPLKELMELTATE